MKYYYLLIKKCIVNNKQYLCKRIAKCDRDAIRYTGSGKIVLRLKKKYGSSCMQHVDILAKYPYDQFEEFSAVCKDYSKKFNVVESDDWLNLMEEDGRVGGAMALNDATGKKWMFKDNVRKRVRGEDVERFISEGWSIGTPLEYRQRVSERNKGLIPWNKGKRVKNENEYVPKYVIKTEEEKFINRSEGRKKLVSSPEYLAKFKRPRKPLLRLQNVITGEIIEIGRQKAIEVYRLQSMHVKLLQTGKEVKGFRLIS